MDKILQQLASDISLLKWLLGIVSVFLLIVTTMLVFAFMMLQRAVKNSDQRAASNFFQDQADNLLEEGKNAELKVLAEDRIKDYPADAWAHYYLGIAYYRLDDLVRAKQNFIKVTELSPHLKSVADENIEEIDKILSESKPRIV